MKKKYIIIANESVNPSVADSITDYLIKEQKMEVWHWIANAWLAVTDNQPTPGWLLPTTPASAKKNCKKT